MFFTSRSIWSNVYFLNRLNQDSGKIHDLLEVSDACSCEALKCMLPALLLGRVAVY